MVSCWRAIKYAMHAVCQPCSPPLPVCTFCLPPLSFPCWPSPARIFHSQPACTPAKVIEFFVKPIARKKLSIMCHVPQRPTAPSSPHTPAVIHIYERIKCFALWLLCRARRPPAKYFNMLQRIQRQQQQPAEAGAGTEQKQTRRQIQFAFCCTVAAKKMFTRRAKVSSEVGVGFFCTFYCDFMWFGISNQVGASF